MARVGSKTYNNEPVEEYISIGVEQLLIAPEGTTWSVSSGPAMRLNINSPPSGFRHLGAVVDDSPSVKITKGAYELKTGVLNVLRKRYVNDMSATFTARLFSMRGIDVMYALGNGYFTHISGSAVGTDCSTVASVTSRRVITLVGSDVSSIIPGNAVVISTVASINKTYNEGIVSSVTIGAGFYDLTFVDSLDTLPVANERAAKLYATKVPGGTSVNKYYVLLGVADTSDGWQIIHHFPKAIPSGEWTEEIRRDKATDIPIEFAAIGQESSAWDNELIVLERFDVRSY